MGVHDVDAPVGEVERVNVTDLEGDRVDAGGAGRGPSLGQRSVGPVDSEDATGRDPPGQVDGDRARPATDVERWPGRRCGSRYPAEFSAVRRRCERRTLSACPWV
jgi:hypothetical protein